MPVDRSFKQHQTVQNRQLWLFFKTCPAAALIGQRCDGLLSGKIAGRLAITFAAAFVRLVWQR
jgi:hypothetical protein